MKTLRSFSLVVFSVASIAMANVTLMGDLGTHRTHSAKTLGSSKLVFGVSGRGSKDSDKILEDGVVRKIIGFDTTTMLPSDRVNDTTAIDELFDLTTRVFLALGVSNYFDLGLSLPIHSDWLTGMGVKENNDLSEASSVGLGDLEISGKLQYPPYEHDHTWDMALMGIVTLPTGSKSKGFVPKEIYYIPKNNSAATKFYTAQEATLTLLLLNTVDFHEINPNLFVQWHLNLGLLATASSMLDNSFLLNSSVQWMPTGHVFGLFLEFSGVTRTSNFSTGFKLGDDPLFLTPGFYLDADNGFSVSLALDINVATGNNYSELRLDPNPGPRTNVLCESCVNGDGQYYSYHVKPATDIGVSATLNWSGFLIPRDKDNDGILDEEDLCIEQPEDMDGFQDSDGCPEYDNDEDGVEDLEDLCPLKAEDVDGFQDNDGCPELDNDQDKIPDQKDKCPNEAEDFNGFQDEDGCPDGKGDKDKDGIPDYQDACPDKPEDMDGFDDLDGCPEWDNDNDSIPDDKDRCPMAAEVYNQFEDEDGCPDQAPIKPLVIVKKDTLIQRDTVVQKVMIEKKAKIVLHGVNFATGSAELTPESFPKLDGVAEALRVHPEIRLEISGHSDNRGSLKLNKRLSLKRAQSVVRYLVSQGARPEQLTAIGYGPKYPIASNKSAAGREKNRRIEMRRTDD